MKKMIIGLGLGAIAAGATATGVLVSMQAKATNDHLTNTQRHLGAEQMKKYHHDIHGAFNSSSEDHIEKVADKNGYLYAGKVKVAQNTLASVVHNFHMYNGVRMDGIGEVNNVTLNKNLGFKVTESKRPFLMGSDKLAGKKVLANIYATRKDLYHETSTLKEFPYYNEPSSNSISRDSLFARYEFMFENGNWYIRAKNDDWRLNSYTYTPNGEDVRINKFANWQIIKGKKLSGLNQNLGSRTIANNMPNSDDTLILGSSNLTTYGNRTWSVGITQKGKDLYLENIDNDATYDWGTFSTYVGNFKIATEKSKDNVLNVPSEFGSLKLRNIKDDIITFDRNDKSNAVINEIYRAYKANNPYKYIRVSKSLDRETLIDLTLLNSLLARNSTAPNTIQLESIVPQNVKENWMTRRSSEIYKPSRIRVNMPYDDLSLIDNNLITHIPFKTSTKLIKNNEDFTDLLVNAGLNTGWYKYEDLTSTVKDMRFTMPIYPGKTFKIMTTDWNPKGTLFMRGKIRDGQVTMGLVSLDGTEKIILSGAKSTHPGFNDEFANGQMHYTNRITGQRAGYVGYQPIDVEIYKELD